MRKFGLIGYPLSHSFSKKYFTDKFLQEGIENSVYDLYPLKSIGELDQLIQDNPELVGLNVTIPYKEAVFPYLDEIDPHAQKIGAVNTIKIVDKKRIGYNSDYYGFQDSLTKFFGANPTPEKALILGTGGASKAVKVVLEDLGIDYQLVSRKSHPDCLTYTALVESPELISEAHLIVNTTPLGMSPNIDELPEIAYDRLTENHFLYDLVYNPLKTAFMQKGIEAKCWVKNGLEMLHGQAEKSWELWNK
ncbi:shikimate dehydrogenase family protein [Roseivirga misakiensis]|uniref:Shikimate dehydrogenase n=1 Tax=Roseivirga misakiensis TaxID=1563681 RepID=A0A1E5T5S3_9BACT|nr:shikimate dehydrogenase [Roseivirga misakiensis]OEK06732.1 shikimate dehydrogenase [Roseivirga misakiensis]